MNKDEIVAVLQQAYKVMRTTTAPNNEFTDALDALDAAIGRMEAAPAVHNPFANWLLGDWFKAKTIDDMEAFYWSRLPAIRGAARELGYAIGVHGSCRRDFDLMAMPWREDASSKDELAKAIQNAACGISSDSYRWEQKQAGRTATSMCICWIDHANPDFKNMVSVGHIDLSVIAAGSATPAVPEGWQLVPKIRDAEDTPEQLGQGHETVQRIWDSQMNIPDKCSQCGFPEREHHHGGACYGICGKFDKVSIQQPAGYTLVPNEPTPEMLRATEYILLNVYGKPEGVSRLSKDAYKAMLAAAPQFTEKEQAK